MHEESPILAAKTRERLGTRYSKRIRQQGGLPAIVYGHGEEPSPITLDAHTAVRMIEDGEKVFKLAVEGGSSDQYVLLRDLQFDYLGTNIVHADFSRVDLNERVETSAKLDFVGDAKGLKTNGAILVHPVESLDLECVVTNLPDFIEVDVSDLDVGDVIRAGDVKLPKDTMVLLTDPQTVVAQVVVQLAEEEDAESATVEGGAEPEVLTEKKKEEED